MIQYSIESTIILYAFQALLAGLLFVFCAWQTKHQQPWGRYAWFAVAFLLFAGSSVASAIDPISRLREVEVPNLTRLFAAASLLETASLGCLLARLAPSRRWRYLAALLIAPLVVADLAVGQLFSGEAAAPFRYHRGGFSHLALILVLSATMRNGFSKGPRWLQGGLFCFLGSYVAEAVLDVGLFGPSAFLWNVQQLGKVTGLVAFAIHFEQEETTQGSAGFAFVFSLTVALSSGVFSLLLSEILRSEYLAFAATEAQMRLGTFLQGHVVYFHTQGLAPLAILEREELTRGVVSELASVPGLKQVKIQLADDRLLMGIDPDGSVSYQLESASSSRDDTPARDDAPSTVAIFREPLLHRGEQLGWVEFGADPVFVSHRVVEAMRAAFSSLTGVAFAALVAAVLYGRHRQVQREAELTAQLQQAQKMETVGRLAGGIAHDFNNLLTVILGYIELLIDGLGDDDPRRADAEEVKKAGTRAAALTRQLLAFSRKQMLQPQVLDLSEVVRNIEKMLARVVGENVELHVVAPHKVAHVKVDPSQIEQVIMNLVINARDAMPKGGRVSLKTRDVELGEAFQREHSEVRPGRYVMLSVSDNGQGMEAETLARVFEPFFTTKEKGKGTGLGLSTVYGIIKQSGGYIYGESKPGQGTTFTIYLPTIGEPVGAPAAVSGVSARNAKDSETVLLVEDERPVRVLAFDVLCQAGYRVLEAQDAEQALELSRSHAGHIDLLLTDVVMPGVDGRELAGRLTAARSETKVLFMSGYTGDALANHGEWAQGIAFLPKPFTPDELLRKVKETLS